MSDYFGVLDRLVSRPYLGLAMACMSVIPKNADLGTNFRVL